MEINKELKQKSGIYRIYNLKKEKCYIGSTVNLHDRLTNGHLYNLRLNQHGNKKLQNFWNKYGEIYFHYEILEFVDDINKLIEREQYYLDVILFARDYIDSDFKDKRFIHLGLNNSPTATNTLGFLHGEETKRQQSKSGKEKWKDEKYREKQKYNPRNLGIKSSDVKKKKLSVTNKQFWQDNPDKKKELSDLMNSSEMNDHLSSKSKQMWQNPEYIKKQEWTEDKKQKLSKSVADKWNDPVYRDNRNRAYRQTVDDPNYISPKNKKVELTHSQNNQKIILGSKKIATQWLKDLYGVVTDIKRYTDTGRQYKDYYISFID